MTYSINTQSKKLAKYWQIYLNLTGIYIRDVARTFKGGSSLNTSNFMIAMMFL